MIAMFNQKRNYPSRVWFLIPIVLVAAIICVAALFYFYGPPVANSYPFYGWWFPFPWFFLIPVFLLIFFGFRWIFWGGWGGGWYYWNYYNDPALEILKERFSRGELTKEQFDQMVRDIEQH